MLLIHEFFSKTVIHSAFSVFTNGISEDFHFETLFFVLQFSGLNGAKLSPISIVENVPIFNPVVQTFKARVEHKRERVEKRFSLIFRP